MKRLIIGIVIIIGCFFSSLVIGDNSFPVIKGNLIFGLGQGLYKLNFKACKITKLYENKMSVFNKVSKLDKNKFLFLQDGPPDIVIKMFDLRNNSISSVYQGATSPYYNLNHKKLFFNYIRTYKEGPFVYEADLQNSAVTKVKKVAVGSSYTNSIGVISVSPDEVVFNYSASKNHINLYNMVTDKLETLPIKNCDYPQIWRSKTKQLMCYNPRKQEYFLTDLKEKNTQFVKKGSNFLPVLYLSKYDDLLFTITSFSLRDPEEGHLGIYNFATGKSKILCDNIDIGIGDAAYFARD